MASSAVAGSERTLAPGVDVVASLPVTPRGNTYILLITDRFSRRADMFPVTAAEFTVVLPTTPFVR